MKIIDDFLPKEVFEHLQKYVLSMEFPWFYSEAVSIDPRANDIQDPMAVETDGLHHIIFDPENDAISFVHKVFTPFYQELEHRFGFKPEHLIRNRLSQKTPKIGFVDGNYNIPHVDYFRPHVSLIFYFNDSDGPTYIFDQEFRFGKRINKGFTVKDRVYPKANRLLWIDGWQYHTASNPIQSNRRVILNLNLECLST